MSAELSRLLWDAREMLDMAADQLERGVGPYRDLVIQIDAYRARQGWSPNGFGGEPTPDQHEVHTEWTMRYKINGDEQLGEDVGYVFDSREQAENDMKAWQKLFARKLTYTDVRYLRRTVRTGPWNQVESEGS